MASLLRVGMVYYSFACAGLATSHACDNRLCSCPCHSITDEHPLAAWKDTTLGLSLLHLAFSYRRSPLYSEGYVTALQRAAQPDIQST